MSIKGISDKRRLPRLGKIRLGEKVIRESGADYPKALDHFNCPDDVQTVYGEAPTVLDIMLPVEDTETIFPQYLKRYGKAKGLVCKGDGETALARNGEGEMVEIECNPDECLAYQNKQCRRVASLQFMLPTVPGFGVWQIDTTSYHSIVNLNSAFDMLRSICARISGIPLKLRVEPKEVVVDGSKKTVHVLNLTTAFSVAQLLEASKRAGTANLELPAPADDMPTDLYPKATPIDTEDDHPMAQGTIHDAASPPKPEPAKSTPVKASPPKMRIAVQVAVAKKFPGDTNAQNTYIHEHYGAADTGQLSGDMLVKAYNDLTGGVK